MSVLVHQFKKAKQLTKFIFLLHSDVGYFDVGDKECRFDTSSGFTPTSVPPFCPVGSTYRRTKGYAESETMNVVIVLCALVDTIENLVGDLVKVDKVSVV